MTHVFLLKTPNIDPTILYENKKRGSLINTYNGDKYITYFRQKMPLNKEDRKRFKYSFRSDIEKLYHRRDIRDNLINYTECLISYLLFDDTIGVEIILKDSSCRSAISQGFKGCSGRSIKRMLDYLVDHGYVRKVNERRKYHSKGWDLIHSNLYYSTPKLYNAIKVDPTSKVCNSCDCDKPLVNFEKRSFGYDATCKKCRVLHRKMQRNGEEVDDRPKYEKDLELLMNGEYNAI